MKPNMQFALSLALTFGIPLLLAIRELIVVNRPRRNRGGFQPDPPPPAPRPLPGGAPGTKQLPACLIPTPMPPRAVQKERLLEPV